MQLTNGIDIVKKSFKLYFQKNNFIFLTKVYTFSLLVSLAFYLSQIYVKYLVDLTSSGKPYYALALIAAMCTYIFLDVFTKIAGYIAVRKVINNETFQIKSTFNEASKLWWKFFVVSLISGIIISLGFVLLVVPGIVFATWFAFSLFIIINGKQVSSWEAIKMSKELVKGRFWKVLGRLTIFVIFGLIVGTLFSFIPYALGSTVLTIFGGLFVLPSYLLYLELEKD